MYPKISYCIPVFNEQDIIIDSIEKIKLGLNKILGDNRFEIIIVENGSTDNTFRVLKTFKKQKYWCLLRRRKRYWKSIYASYK